MIEITLCPEKSISPWRMKKNIAIFVCDNVEILDFAGAYEVFSIANDNYIRRNKIEKKK